MSKPGNSIFRHALQVAPGRIARMSDDELNTLMDMLLKARAHKCGSALSEIRINTEGNAPDDGCDGWSDKPTSRDGWLGSEDTCWQFKAGAKGKPAHLAGEVTKRIPQETLASGGRFVVVASGSTNGKKGERARLAKLIAEAEEAKIPTEKIEVIGSERLATWCNQHPAIAAHWTGRPEGLWTFDDWSNSPEHQVPWQQPKGKEFDFESRRADLDFAAGTVYHLHIHGHPGVGKTRFALELCRVASLRDTVIYIRQATDVRLMELIDSAVADAGVQLVVVADEVQADQLRPLRASVGRGNGSIRLITIGHCSTPDSSSIPAILIRPLEREVMSDVIRGWYPSMPPEHVGFVAGFAGGYVRLGRLASDSVVLNPSMNVRGLLSRDDIHGFLDGMLGVGDRPALYVVAVLTTVGWTEDKQHEGEAVARHLCLDWNEVRASVEDFHRRLGIAPRGGRYRYISPTPLGIHLAAEAWETYPDLLASLADVLPSEDAKDAYYERLKSIASNPQAREFAREQLAFFFRIEDFVDARAVRRWAALSSADPDQGARNVQKALSNASIENRKQIGGDARRQMVWALVRLAWKQSSFHDATVALALLAEAENETWSNNASAEFVNRFQIGLGGTAVPYLDRLEVLDELLSTHRPALAKLVVKSLAQAANDQAIRVESGPVSDQLSELEWQPRTNTEYFECVETAMKRLVDIAKLGIADLEDDFLSVAERLSAMLFRPSMGKLVTNFLDTVRIAYPVSREPLRRAIARFIEYERKYDKTLPEAELEEINKLRSRFEDSSLGSRLQQLVAEASLDRENQVDLKPLASELMSTPNALIEHWPWLTSGDAADSWRLGEALAGVDPEGALAETLPILPGTGRDLRLLCGYISARRQDMGDEWYEKWLASQSKRRPKPLALIFDTAWRCGMTASVALILAEIMASEQVSSEIVGRLGYGSSVQNLPVEPVDRLLHVMTQTGHHETAISVLINRMQSHPGEIDHWKSLGLELVTSPDLIRSRQMTNFYWKGVAKILVAEHASEIASAILREHQNSDWLIGYSGAEEVLRACVERDPTGVWQALRPYLSSPSQARVFCIGLPVGVFQCIPPHEIILWVREQPEERAKIIAHLPASDLSTDESLESILLGEFGDNEEVANVFFSKFISGAGYGPISSHWNRFAESLDQVAGRTKLQKLRRWAQKYASVLREMAEEARRREEEEELDRR
jgi:hypothetical protein